MFLRIQIVCVTTYNIIAPAKTAGVTWAQALEIHKINLFLLHRCATPLWPGIILLRLRLHPYAVLGFVMWASFIQILYILYMLCNMYLLYILHMYFNCAPNCFFGLRPVFIVRSYIQDRLSTVLRSQESIRGPH